MDDEQKGWKRFRTIKLDRKRFARSVRKAENATQRHAHRFIIRRINNVRLVAREITTWLLIVGMLIAGLGIQLMWGQNQYTVKARQSGGTYVEGALGPIGTLNPLYVSTSAEASVAKLIFSSLYGYDDTGSLRQDLATGMTISKNKQVYTVNIRSDARWHDDVPLTAEDIVFTINLIKNPNVRSPLRINWLDVSVSAPTPESVQFTLPAVYAAFPHALTFPILPKHLLEDVAPAVVRESAYSQSPVGSGPFSFRRLQAIDVAGNAKVVHMSANPHYYKGAPKLTRFELHAYQDEDSLLRAVNSGEVSGATDISVTSAKKVTSSRYKVTSEALDSGVYLLFNTTNPTLKSKTVRQALRYATDTKEIRSAIGGGVLPLDGPLLTGQLTGKDVPLAAISSLARAQKLLDKEGWKIQGSYRVKGDTPLEITITTTKDNEYGAVLNQVTEQWKKLGVKVNTKVIDTASASSTFVQDVLQGRNFEVLLYELSIGADPDVYAYWHSSQVNPQGYNFSNYSNELVDASLGSARARLEPELRNAKYKQFVRQWLDDVPAIGLYQAVVEYASSTNVDSVQPGAHLVTNSDRYANVLYWTVSSDSVYKTP